MKQAPIPRFIYITGCDGTGKSTQAKLLVDTLRTRGIQPIHLWLRFPILFSAPLLLYARWRKYSWSEVQQGVKHGYWNFQTSWLMRAVFPWVYLLDAALASLWKVYIPLLFRKTIVCERYVIDMLADIEMGLGDDTFHQRAPGKLFPRLIPKGSRIIILDLDEGTVRARRADLSSDWMLEKRLFEFRHLSEAFHLQTVDSYYSIEQVHNSIWDNVS